MCQLKPPSSLASTGEVTSRSRKHSRGRDSTHWPLCGWLWAGRGRSERLCFARRQVAPPSSVIHRVPGVSSSVRPSLLHSTGRAGPVSGDCPVATIATIASGTTTAAVHRHARRVDCERFHSHQETHSAGSAARSLRSPWIRLGTPLHDHTAEATSPPHGPDFAKANIAPVTASPAIAGRSPRHRSPGTSDSTRVSSSARTTGDTSIHARSLTFPVTAPGHSRLPTWSLNSSTATAASVPGCPAQRTTARRAPRSPAPRMPRSLPPTGAAYAGGA